MPEPRNPAARTHLFASSITPGQLARLPVDVVYPDPDPAVGDPWPCHLCSPAVDWPVPPAAVLRPDRPVAARAVAPLAPQPSPWARSDVALGAVAGAAIALLFAVALLAA
jgi:hypothetical protein